MTRPTPTLPRRRGLLLIATIVSVALVSTACTAGAPDSSTPVRAGLDADAIDAVASDLPDHPVAVAEQLVAAILTDDGSRATAATAELLRRSGHAIVSASGPVLAMPDQAALFDAPVYAELVPLLTEATRAGDHYTLEEFATLLTAVGVTEQDATPAHLAVVIGDWAKEPDDHPIVATAAAGVRALGGAREHVFYDAVASEDVFLDPLQTIILLGHATSRLGEVDADDAAAARTAGPRAAAGPELIDWLLGAQPAHASSPAGPCGQFASLFATPENPVVKAESDWVKGQFKDRLSKDLLTPGEKAALDKAGDAWGKASAVASAILLLLAARIELSADKASTHFKHRAGTRDEHITITATALFDPQIALDKLECYSLAGLSVPKPGPLKDMTVRWESIQPQVGSLQEGGNQLLQAVSADKAKFTRGSKTGADGRTTLELKPPVEDPSGEGAKLTGVAVFKAKLDKENFPFELSDIASFLSNAVGFAAGKTFDLVKEVFVKAGLPTQTISLNVEYHGADIVVAQGANEVNLILAKLPKVYVDLVSCAGVAGPFKGSAGYDGAVSGGMLQAAGAITGVPVPAEFAGKDNPISVLTNDRKGPNPFFIMTGEGGAQFLDGVLTFYPFLNARAEILRDGRVGRPVGEVEILLGGSSFPLSDLSWPIVRVQKDSRCPEVRYFYDGL